MFSYYSNGYNAQVDKDSLRIESIGSIDELNSYLGITKGAAENHKVKNIIVALQRDLFTIGSILAGSSLRFNVNKTNKLERQIDKWEKELPPLKNFIIPAGSNIATKLHFARSLSRRAERKVVSLSKQEKVNTQILSYLNRLSDLLFVLSRLTNYELGIEEEPWAGEK